MRHRGRSGRAAALLLLGALLVPGGVARAAAACDGTAGDGTARDAAASGSGWALPLPPGARPERARAAVDTRSLPHGDARVEGVAHPAAPGAELEFTVHPALERDARRVLAEHGAELAHLIVMDPSTGELFAYVSTDPERFPGTRAYPTASLMKLVTASAVLRRAPEASARSCRYQGSPWELAAAQLRPPEQGGTVASFVRALATSNNQCFARLAVHDVGRPDLLAEIAALGLLESPAAAHASGRVELARGALALGHLGTGMKGAFATPLGALQLVAALATGERVAPWWVGDLRDAEGDPLPLPPRPPGEAVLATGLRDRLREAMVAVTESGTARRAFTRPDGTPRLAPVRVAGKTGTVSGSAPDGRYRWFVGLAPAEAPRVALAVVVVDSPEAPRSAARLAAAVLEQIFCDGGVCSAEHAGRLHARARARDGARAERVAARARQERLRRARANAARHEQVGLDASPRPLGDARLDIPRRLRREAVRGEIVLLVELSPEGRVLDARVDASDLPEFEELVTTQVRGWRFTPPTRGGRPVEARARLPIPIVIE